MTRRSRLDVVLRMRELAEQTARAQLGEALAAYDVARASAERLRERTVEERAWLGQLLAQPAADAAELRAAADAVDLAERQALLGREQLRIAERTVEGARESLAAATRAREVVERLQTRLRAAERQAAERREIAELAEIASVRHVWKGVEGSP